MQQQQITQHVQQRVVQLQRAGLRDNVGNHLISVSSSTQQLIQHPSPTSSQSSLISSSAPMTPRPPPSVTPSTPLTPATPSTPLQQDLSSQSPISNEIQSQLPVINPPPPPPYPGPPPPYPSQLKVKFRHFQVIFNFLFFFNTKCNFCFSHM